MTGFHREHPFRRTRSALAAALTLLLIGLMVAPPVAASPPQGPPRFPPTVGGHVGVGPLDPREADRSDLGGSALYAVQTNDSSAVPTWGIALQVRSLVLPPPTPQDIFQINVELSLGGVDVLVGLFSNETLPITPFWAIYNRTNDLLIGIEFDPNLPIQNGVVYTMAAQGAYYGTGILWSFTVDGTPLGTTSTFEVSNSTADPTVGSYLLVRWDEALFVPASTDIPCILATDVNGTWRVPRPAVVIYDGPPGLDWGLQGRAGNSSLAPGELITGSSVGVPANGSMLWSAGTAPLSLTAVITGGLARDGDAVGRQPLTLKATVAGDLDLAGLPLNWTDRTGTGIFTSGSTSLDGQDEAVDSYTPAISTTPQTVTLSVAPGVFGWTGSANLSVVVDPATLVDLQVTCQPSYVPSGESGTVDVRVTALNGSPLGGVVVDLNVTPNHGGLDDPKGSTDAQGVAMIAFDSPPLVGRERVLNETFVAVVLSPGFLGNGSGGLVVGPPLPPPTRFPAVSLADGVALGLFAVALLALARWYWGPRKKLPDLPLSEQYTAPAGEAYTEPSLPPPS